MIVARWRLVGLTTMVAVLAGAGPGVGQDAQPTPPPEVTLPPVVVIGTTPLGL